jgi:hypothetical protein
MIDDAMFGDSKDGKLDPMIMKEHLEFMGASIEPDGTLNIDMPKYHKVYRRGMYINQKLQVVREYALDLRQDFAKRPHKKNPEILSMISGILDRVMQIENEIGDGYGRDQKDGAQGRVEV